MNGSAPSRQDGFVLKLDDYIAKYPQHFGTIFPSLWSSAKCPDGTYAIPQDAEARMFFYNKKLLREAGYDAAFVDALPERALSGDLTMDELLEIAKQVVDKTKAQYGILHRPNKGPDYIMVFHAYGNDFVDPATGNLLLERDKLAAAFGWFERGVKEGVIPANNTAMEFDALRKEFYTGNAAFWMYGIWDLGSVAFPTYGLPKDEKAFFADWGWIAGPAAEEGRIAGQPDPSDRLCYCCRAPRSRNSLPACLATPRRPTSTPITRLQRPISASSPSNSKTHAISRPGRSPGRPNCSRSPNSCPTTRSSRELNGIIYAAIQGIEFGAVVRARMQLTS